MSRALKANVVSDNRVGGSSGHKSRAGNVFSSCYLWPSLKGKQMALLSELFCSCFKWLIQIKHGILFLVKAAAALSELGCFYQCSPPPTPQPNGQRRPRRPHCRHCSGSAAQGELPPSVRLSVCPQQPGLLLAMPLSLGCDCVVGGPPPPPDFHSFTYLIPSKA